MTPRRITAITVETAERFTISGAFSATVRCVRCGSSAAVLANAQASATFWAGIRAIAGEIDRNRIHTATSESGSTIVCLDSLCQAAPQLPGNSTLKFHPSKENPK